MSKNPFQVLSDFIMSPLGVEDIFDEPIENQGLPPIMEDGTNQFTSEDIYHAIAFAETGGWENPWIRTSNAPVGGSTAYGPVQLTGGQNSMIANVILGNASLDYNDLTKEEQDFLELYREQAGDFAKWGLVNPNTEGYDEKYDYGPKGSIWNIFGEIENLSNPQGTGIVGSRQDYRDLYKSVSMKLIEAEYSRLGGNFEKFLAEWRYGSQGADKGMKTSEWRDYYNKVTNYLDNPKPQDYIDKRHNLPDNYLQPEPVTPTPEKRDTPGTGSGRFYLTEEEEVNTDNRVFDYMTSQAKDIDIG